MRLRDGIMMALGALLLFVGVEARRYLVLVDDMHAYLLRDQEQRQAAMRGMTAPATTTTTTVPAQ